MKNLFHQNLFTHGPNYAEDQIPLEKESITLNPIIGQTIIKTSNCLGSYGMGGPGFTGLKLSNGKWMVFALWGADDWLNFTVNSTIYSLSQDNRIVNKQCPPLLSWKEFDKYSVGSKVKDFYSDKDSFSMIFEKNMVDNQMLLIPNEYKISIEKNSELRPYWVGTRSPRILLEDENLSDAIFLTFSEDILI